MRHAWVRRRSRVVSERCERCGLLRSLFPNGRILYERGRQLIAVNPLRVPRCVVLP